MLCGWIQRFGAVRASKQVLKKEYHPPTDVAIRWIINLGFVYRCSTPRSPRSISCLGPGLYLRGMNPAFGGPPSLINVYYIYILYIPEVWVWKFIGILCTKCDYPIIQCWLMLVDFTCQSMACMFSFIALFVTHWSPRKMWHLRRLPLIR